MSEDSKPYDCPVIHVHVIFFSSEEGGRFSPARLCPDYRPHLVVGETIPKEAIVDDSGRSQEQYLGVSFAGDYGVAVPGTTYEVLLNLFYYPQVDYSALTEGNTFTVREGGKIVGYGEVTDGLGER